MNKIEANQIIYTELSKVYAICKIEPTNEEWETFLETKSTWFQDAFKAYHVATAWKELFIFRHHVLRKYHAQYIDELMKINLDKFHPGLFAMYQKYYIQNLNR